MATSIVMLVITALLTLTVVTSALGAGMEELAFEVALGTWIANS